MDPEFVRSARFWEMPDCHVAGGKDGHVHVDCGGGCVIFPTSGSTGESKSVVLRKDALLVSAKAVNDWLGAGVDAVWGLALPMNHVGGFGVAARAHAAACGFSHYVRKWDPANCARWLRSDGVTHVSLVPAQVHDLVAAGLKAPGSLGAVVVGGGRLSNGIGQAARDLGWPVLASYGMTEAASQVATQPLSALDKPFVDCPLGVLPIWETGLAPGGLLRLRGDALFCGTVAAGEYHPRQGQWFTTSDRVALSEGDITPLGRADSMVKVLGELVDVDAVERRFAEFCEGRGIRCGLAVVALPDKRREHVLVAVFEGTDVPVTAEDYNSQATGLERIAGSCAVAALPRSPMGKLLRATLVDTLLSSRGH